MNNYGNSKDDWLVSRSGLDHRTLPEAVYDATIFI